MDSTKSQVSTAVFDQAPRNILSMLIFEPASYTAAKPPFNDDRVRRALSMAINRDALLKRVTPEGGLWPNMPINGGFGKSWWLDPQGSDIGAAGANYKFDVAGAKALLSAAGFENGFEIPMHFASTVYTTIVPYYPIVKDGLTALFAAIGVKVKEVPEEYGSYISTTFAGQFDGMAFSLESVFSDIAA